MPNKLLRFIIILLLCISCLSCADESKPSRPIAKATPETKAPDFTLKDLTGKLVKLSSLQGNPVLLIFTATWCPECRRELPYFKQLHESYHSRGLHVINIDIMESQDRVRSFADKHEIPYRTLLDEYGRVAESYGVYGIPAAVLIDKNGTILCSPCRSLDRLLDAIFANQ